MVALLIRCAYALAWICASSAAFGADLGERHEWEITVDLGYPSASTDLGPWTSGGFGKLRFDSADRSLTANRLAVEYRGRLTETLSLEAILDYIDDASAGADLTEAYLDWRPIPESSNQHQVRVGAFYPPFSLENRGSAWSSPFTSSFSAINAWLGEEIRPFGVEWSLQRRIGFAGSPHRLGAFAAAFYGNDPAGTLLFWRGFALHGRQTRLNDRLALPPAPVFGANGAVIGLRAQTLEPFAEIDDEPGYYAGIEWRYARRALAQIAIYDNRADPGSFRDGQWSWRTRFHHAALQLGLPRDFGLISQWMAGATYWLTAATSTGLTTPATTLARDDFESTFVMLTKRISATHRVSLRYDEFDLERIGELDIDSGNAWTLAYHHQSTPKLGVVVEWLSIKSARDLWSAFYGLPRETTERQLRVQLNYRLHSRAR
jgi:hypothetical protein